ncbi:hypothetical protein T12_7312, partial [Trichinella patagoniensis]
LKKWKTTPEMLIGRKPEAAYQIYRKLQSLTYKDSIDYEWFKDKFRSMITDEAEAEGSDDFPCVCEFAVAPIGRLSRSTRSCMSSELMLIFMSILISTDGVENMVSEMTLR